MRHVEGGDFHSEAEANDFLYRLASFLKRDPDVVVVKVADRLHNVQTASSLTRASQERVAGVALMLLVPLAERLGMSMARYQLEDCCFELSNPGYYKLLAQHCMGADLEHGVEDVQQELQQVVNEALPGTMV